MQTIIFASRVHQEMKFRLEEKDLPLFRQYIFRAKKYGYKICLVKLYGNLYYFEKVEEGDGTKYSRTFRSTN